MPWIQGDKMDLWKILRLERDQLIEGSTFNYLFDYAEEFDLDYSTEIVAEMQQLIDEIKTLQKDNPITFDGSAEVKREKVDGEYEIEYQSATNTEVTVKNEINSKRTQILNLLDPDQCLPRYTGVYSGRVVF